MHLALLLASMACTAFVPGGEPRDSAPVETDTEDGESDSEGGPLDDSSSGTAPDTAVGVLVYTGGWSVPGGSFASADIGLVARTKLTGEVLCEARVLYDASGDGQDGCPDCDWAFEVVPTPINTTGVACEDLEGSEGDAFLYGETAATLWLGTGLLDGLGTAASYTYVTDDGGGSYYLGHTFFFHYSYAGDEGWYLMAWNLPHHGYHQIDGNSEAATFMRPVARDGDSVYYYVD